MPEQEEKLWQMDIRMNAFGVKVDQDLIKGALVIDRISTDRLREEAINLTGLENPNSPAQVIGWLEKETLLSGETTGLPRTPAKRKCVLRCS